MSQDPPELRKCDTCHTPSPYEPVTIGDSDLTASLPHHCPDCTQAAKEEEARKKQEERRRHIRETLARVIPPRILDTDPEHPDFNRRAWQALRKWKPTRARPWLVIHGPTALCKTRICSLIARAAIHRGTRTEWTTWRAFTWAATREFDDDLQERTRARQWLAKWQNTTLLIFDDFGKGTGKGTISAALEKHLFALIDHRHTHNLPTIISMNSTPQEMLETGTLSADLGAPLIRRILESAGTIHTLKPTPKQ